MVDALVIALIGPYPSAGPLLVHLLLVPLVAGTSTKR